MESSRLGNEQGPIELGKGVRVRRVTKTGYGATCECGHKFEALTIERLRYLYREHRHHIHQEAEA